MKISNSKKQLAKIISENGGWREGAEFAAQDGDGTGSIDFFKSKPHYCAGDKYWRGKYDAWDRIEKSDVTIKNYHQTILSRDEYFHLYPAPDAVMAKAEEPEHVWTNPPTIESLAADYRSKLAIAKQAQEEADSHRCGAEAALEKLVAAGKALGLVLSVAATEPELAVTDWRDLQEGDEVEVLWAANPNWVRFTGKVISVASVGVASALCSHGGDFWNIHDGTKWRFIRRPAKEDNHA